MRRTKKGFKLPIKKKPGEMSAKEEIGRLFSGLAKEKWTTEKFMKLCNSVGIVTTLPTLSRWKVSFESSGSVLSEDDHRSRRYVLELSERLILCGWAFEKFNSNTPVNLEGVMEFCKSSIDVILSRSTAHNYMHSLGFKWKKCKKRTAGYRPSKKSLISQALDFIVSLDRPMLPPEVASLDFTYTTHRTRAPHGYGPSGAEQPLDSGSTTSYTNCVLTLVWGDAVNRTPAMVFTNDPIFVKDRRGRGIPKGNEEKRKNAFAEFGIDEGRVRYMEGRKTKSGNKPHYAYETLEMVEIFFESFKKEVFSGAKFLFSDDAKMVSSLDSSYFSRYGFEKWIKYPPAVHHYFSPNDNGLHGPAKARWKNCLIDKKDDLRSTCFFLHTLDDCTPFVEHAFEDNLQLSRSYPSRELANRLVFGKHFKKHSFYHNCLFDYNLWSGEDTKTNLYFVPEQLSDSMDGAYYMKVKNNEK